jgi:hypothetical protein
MMRNLTAADLGLDIFCGAEPRRAEAGLGYYDDAARSSQTETTARASAEMPTAPTHFEFNEEQEADGPDAHDAEVESDMEREARHERRS